MQPPAKAEEEVPVLIVGGGAGLTASMLLARLGVRHLLVSARPLTSDLPKAHGAEPEGDGGPRRGRGRGRDRAAQHARRADGSHRVLRGPRRAGPRLRAAPGPTGVLGSRRRR